MGDASPGGKAWEGTLTKIKIALDSKGMRLADESRC